MTNRFRLPCRMSVLAWHLCAAAAAIGPRPALAQDASLDSTRGRRRIQPLPAIGSAPETGMQWGATVLAVFEPAALRRARPGSVIATAIRSAKGQTRVSVEAEHWSTDNTRRVQGTLLWQRYPLPFYGIGVDAPESAREIFTPTGIEASLSVQQRIEGAWYALAGTRWLDQTIRPDSQGVLRTDAHVGSRGGRVGEFIIGLLHDTRDHVFQPTRGTFAQGTLAVSRKMLGSEFDFRRQRYDVRHYRTLGHGQVLALQAQATVASRGDTPFDQLPLVGSGDILRGYTRGRYRGTLVSAAQAEYRTGFRQRVGAVLFGGVGALTHHDSTGTRSLALPTYGAGLRVQIDPRQRTAVRVDYGRGRDGASGLYIGFNQAF